MKRYVPKGIIPVDSHVHIYSVWEDGKEQGFDNYKTQLEAYRKEGGFSFVNVLAIPYLRTRDVCQNLMIAILKLENPNFYGYGGLVYPNQPIALPFSDGFSPEEQLRDLMAVGFDGIKMLESKPNSRKLLGVPLNSPAYEPFFDAMEQSGQHLVWHVNDPANFWNKETFINSGINPAWCYDGKGFLKYEEIYAEVFEVLRSHPSLKVTFAHLLFMSEQPDRLVNLLERYPNITVDLAPGIEMYPAMSKNPARWREIFTQFADRIIFATDFLTTDNPKEKADAFSDIYRFLLTDDSFTFYTGKQVKGLGLDKKSAEQIISHNFMRQAGGTPRPINREAFKAYIRKYEHTITDTHNKERIFAYCEENGLL